MINSLNELFEQIKNKPTRVIAVAAAEDDDIINIVKKSSEMALADFILVGDKNKIEELSSKIGLALDNVEIIDEPDHKLAAGKAVELVKTGKASSLMKGNLHTSVFLKAVIDKEKGLRKGNLISQISVYDKVYGEGLQLLTDCAMSIQPSLEEKKSIIENAIDLAHKLGYEKPRVALLSALEVVNPAIADTIDAAVLSKMGDRGQIKGGIIDGPFALDNAVSVEAAEHKGIDSDVAGKADILVAPNLQVGNALHKSIVYFAKKNVAAAVVGTTAPIIMTSRTDTVENKLLSIALAAYISN